MEANTMPAPLPPLFAYFSPETLLPVTSIVATVIGVVMMGGKTTFRIIARWFRRVLPGRKRVVIARRPHFKARAQEPAERARS